MFISVTFDAVKEVRKRKENAQKLVRSSNSCQKLVNSLSITNCFWRTISN